MPPARPVVHLIGHGHIDPTWLWRWTEGFEEIRATFRSAADRLDEYPEVFFTASSACFHDWIAEVDPALLERIRGHVHSGRWELAGGFWIEPDCNIPSGEALVRQGLLGQRRFRELFGQRARIGFNPDSFGHAGQLPQILKKLGLERYAFMRPMAGSEYDYPGGTTFWWIGPDGSALLTCNILESYNADLDIIVRASRFRDSAHLSAGQQHILGFFGIGNHGGGPTREVIEAIQRYQRGEGVEEDTLRINDPLQLFGPLRDHVRDFPREAAAPAPTDMPRLKFSTLADYFSAFEAASPRIPEVRGDLQHHARGCYSAHSGIKQMNRATEHALLTAEALCARAWIQLGAAYPRAALRDAWKKLLYNQFHDIIAGTCIRAAYTDARDMMGAARHAAHAAGNLALQRLAHAIDTRSPGNTVIVFNPHPWAVRAPALLSPIVDRTLEHPLHLVDSREAPVDLQAVTGDVVGGERYAFIAKVPAGGHSCYHARSGAVPVVSKKSLSCSIAHLENDWWRIRVDGCGKMTELYDKKRGVLLAEEFLQLTAIKDDSDTWSHGVSAYEGPAAFFAGAAAACVAESGAVLATLRRRLSLRNSSATVDITLYRESPDIDVSLRLLWCEPHHVLKLGFATLLEQVSTRCETAYGWSARACDGSEEPCQQWCLLEGTLGAGAYHLAVINDGTYGYDARNGALRMTLLRSPAFAHHMPVAADPALGWEIMDLGEHHYQFRVQAGAGACDLATLCRESWVFNAPPLAHHESAHPGKLAQQAAFIETDADNVLLSVVKQSEEEETLVLRGYETAGRASAATIWLPLLEVTHATKFGAHEIKTFLISRDGVVHEADLLEEWDE